MQGLKHGSEFSLGLVAHGLQGCPDFLGGLLDNRGELLHGGIGALLVLDGGEDAGQFIDGAQQLLDEGGVLAMPWRRR